MNTKRQESYRGKQLAASEHLNDDTADGPHVDDVIPLETKDDLRRPVLTGGDKSGAVAVRCAPLRCAEVDELHAIALRRTRSPCQSADEANVLGLDVRVHHLRPASDEGTTRGRWIVATLAALDTAGALHAMQRGRAKLMERS